MQDQSLLAGSGLGPLPHADRTGSASRHLSEGAWYGEEAAGGCTTGDPIGSERSRDWMSACATPAPHALLRMRMKGQVPAGWSRVEEGLDRRSAAQMNCAIDCRRAV